MSVVVGVKKGNQVAIACDSQISFGSTKCNVTNLCNYSKICKNGESYIGSVGWQASSQVIEDILTYGEVFDFSSHKSVFHWLLAIQKKLSEDYYIETTENDDQPVKSNQIDAMIINKHGIFAIGSYREVSQHKNFWAIGSGRSFALGAIHAVYNSKHTAEEIAEIGAKASAEFNDGCSLPIETKYITIKEKKS